MEKETPADDSCTKCKQPLRGAEVCRVCGKHRDRPVRRKRRRKSL